MIQPQKIKLTVSGFLILIFSISEYKAEIKIALSSWLTQIKDILLIEMPISTNALDLGQPLETMYFNMH